MERRLLAFVFQNRPCGWLCCDVFAKIGIKLPISSIRVKKFCAPSEFSAQHNLIGFEAPFTLREGLERTSS